MTNKLVFFLLASTLTLVGCSDEALVGEKGWVEISRVNLDSAERVIVETRAADNDLNVDIYNKAGTKVLSYPAGSIVAGKRIEIAAGTYRLHAYTSNYNTAYTSTEPGAAKFSGERMFTVNSDVVTYIEMTVPMINTAVTLTLPEGFSSTFTSYTFTATIGARTVGIADGNTSYFELSGDDTAHFTLSANNADGETMTQSGDFPVAPGKNYNVVFSYGNLGLKFIND